MAAHAASIATAQLQDTFYSANYGDELIVCRRSFPAETTVAAIEAGTVRAEVVWLSADGRAWIDSWHKGEESGEAVYVEKRTTGGCTFHGWVDAVSRRVVQTG